MAGTEEGGGGARRAEKKEASRKDTQSDKEVEGLSGDLLHGALSHASYLFPSLSHSQRTWKALPHSGHKHMQG